MHSHAHSTQALRQRKRGETEEEVGNKRAEIAKRQQQKWDDWQ